ncbi:FecR domain-containing protein [Calidifontibacillus oryziterrae]|uniref:FecR domain-containing protein n=1 Tax=Calidifontibacillus oryziterrae TaxID=1191699 RepID=UPI0002FB31F8|nr:FecR domain-containing protein [Calidifontibacillus oryziterrae]
MKRAKALVSFLLLFSLLIPAFYQANAARVAVIKEVRGEVFVKKGNGTREFNAKEGMSLSEGDSVRTVKKSSANIVYDDGSKTTIAPSSKLTVAKLKNKDAGNQTKVKVVSGKVWNSVKSLSNANDEYDVETPTAVMGVRGTHFLVTTDPITGQTSVSVLDGTIGVSQNSDIGNSSGSSDGPGDRTNTAEQLVTFNQTLSTETIHAPLSDAKELDVQQLVEQVEPEVIVEIIQDLTKTIQEKQKQALENHELFEQTEQFDLLENALELSKTAAELAKIQANVLSEINRSSAIREEVEQLLQSRFNETIASVMRDNQELRSSTESARGQITDSASNAGMSEEEINEFGPEDVPVTPPSPAPDSNGGSSGGGGGNVDERPSAPRISGEGDGTNFYIDVFDYDPAAILKLYQLIGDTFSLYFEIDLTMNEFNYFTLPYDGMKYYVTQTVNGTESLPSITVTAGEEPIEGLAIVSSNAIEDTNEFTITFNSQLDPSSVPSLDDFEIYSKESYYDGENLTYQYDRIYVSNIIINENQLILSLSYDSLGESGIYIEYPIILSIKYTKNMTNPIKDSNGFTLNDQQIDYESTQTIFDRDKNGDFEYSIYTSKYGYTEPFEIYSLPYTLNFKTRFENNFVQELSYQIYNGDNPIKESEIYSNSDGVFSLTLDESLPYGEYSIVLGIAKNSDFRIVNSFGIKYVDYEAPKITNISYTTTPATIQLDFDELINEYINKDADDFKLVEIQGTDQYGQPIEEEKTIASVYIIDDNNKSSLKFELVPSNYDFNKLRLTHKWNDNIGDIYSNYIPLTLNIKFGQYVKFSLDTPNEMAIYHTPIKIEPYKEAFKVYFQPYFNGVAMTANTVDRIEVESNYYDGTITPPMIETDSQGNMYFTIDPTVCIPDYTGWVGFYVIPNDSYYDDQDFLQSFEIEILDYTRRDMP